MRFSELKKSKIILVAFSLLFALTLGACAGPAVEEKPTINIAEGDWTSSQLLAVILEQIIGEQLGYPTTRTYAYGPIAWTALDKGEKDIAPEIWYPTHQAEMRPFLDKGNIELAGVVYTGITTAWAVPTYVIEGDPERGIEPMAPDLKTILDLKKYWQLFENPEKPGLGEVLGGPAGWNEPSKHIILGYDLPLWESSQSDTVIWARVIAAAKRGEPILSIVWAPHWIFAAVPLTILEDVDPPLQEEIDYDKEPYPLKTGWQPANVYKVVRKELKDTAPDVYRLVHNMTFSEDEINELMLGVEVQEEEMADVARDWISKNQAKIDQWLGK